ncbi:MAG: histidine phosphatase family protein [Simkaniaceae bacterium]|nr:histidine phosphatase family protein [Simkaniaceae bacterium]
MNTNREILGGELPWAEITSKGKSQARALGESLKEVEFDLYYTSDVIRTQQTARHFLEVQGKKLQPINRDCRITEKSNGDWEGLSKKKVLTPEVLKYYRNRNFAPGSTRLGESAQKVTDRICSWVLEKAKEHPNKRLIVFSHGYAIRCLTLAALGIDLSDGKLMKVDNTSVTVITSDGKSLSCTQRNDTSHLKK